MNEIKLPHLGEGIEDIEIALWHKDVNDFVAQGEDLVEVITDKASFSVASDVSGILLERKFKEGDNVREGEVLGIIKKG